MAWAMVFNGRRHTFMGILDTKHKKFTYHLVKLKLLLRLRPHKDHDTGKSESGNKLCSRLPPTPRF